jgi:hypothetical protein
MCTSVVIKIHDSTGYISLELPQQHVSQAHVQIHAFVYSTYGIEEIDENNFNLSERNEKKNLKNRLVNTQTSVCHPSHPHTGWHICR